jgi:hypothetical protein
MTAMVSADVMCDANPPDWRGESGTTYQSWSFSTSDDPAHLEGFQTTNHRKKVKGGRR